MVNAKTVTVKLDNAQVRILEAVLPPGVQEMLHSHPACVMYVIEGGKVRNHLANGKVRRIRAGHGPDPLPGADDALGENVGTTTIRLILVELKEHP